MTKKRKEQIINLELIHRNNKIYTNFEKSLEDNLNMDYLFCMECYYRYSFSNGGSCTSYLGEDIFKKVELLKDIDNEIYNYYSSLVYYDREFWKGRQQGYSVKTSFYQYALIEALGEKRFKELPFYGETTVNENSVFKPLFLDGYPVDDLQKHLEYGLMKDEDIEKIQDYIQNKNHGWNTKIRQNFVALDRTPVNEKYLKVNSVLIDVDLNKSKEEILKFVEKIKDDYDLDKKEEHKNYSTKNIPDVYDLLGMRKLEDFICGKKDCIKEKDKNKKMFEKYADILFIFDCKKAYFTHNDINEELIKYYGYGMKSSTITNYYNIAIEYIDNQKYLSFLTGYNQ